MFSGLTQTSSRQREILEVVFRNGWDYMRRLLTGSKADEPNLPTPAVLRNILIDLGPIFVKLGQLLSTRPDVLPADYIAALSTLQSDVPPVPWSEIEVVLRRELREPLEVTFTQIDREAIAAGSIAQVHRVTLADGREAAIKVQRPGIDLIIDQDIALIKSLADLASRSSLGQDYDIKALAEEFTSALRDELDFFKEASYTDQLRRNMASSSWFDPTQLVIPEIYWDLTTENLLVMQWLDGVPLLAAKVPDEPQNGNAVSNRRALTTILFRAFFQQIYIDGFFMPTRIRATCFISTMAELPCSTAA